MPRRLRLDRGYSFGTRNRGEHVAAGQDRRCRATTMGDVQQDVQRRCIVGGGNVLSGAALLIEVIWHLTGMQGMRVRAGRTVLDIVVFPDRRQNRLQDHAQDQQRQEDRPDGRHG